MPSLTLFSTFEVAGHIVVILDDSLKSLFTHRLVEFLVRGASLSLPSRDYQLIHRPLFPFLCLPFFAFLVAGLPAGLVAASSARSSWAVCSTDASRASRFSILARRYPSRSSRRTLLKQP